MYPRPPFVQVRGATKGGRRGAAGRPLRCVCGRLRAILHRL